MMRRRKAWIASWAIVGALIVTLVFTAGWAAVAHGAAPVRIGFGMALTGGLAADRKATPVVATSAIRDRHGNDCPTLRTPGN